MAVRPYYVGGTWRTGARSAPVRNPFDDATVAEVGVPSDADVEEAAATAVATFRESRTLPVWKRAEALDHISRRLAETLEDNARSIALEGGKPLKWARSEAARAVSTFRWASEEVRRGDDEVMRFDTEQALGSRLEIGRAHV